MSRLAYDGVVHVSLQGAGVVEQQLSRRVVRSARIFQVWVELVCFPTTFTMMIVPAYSWLAVFGIVNVSGSL